MEKSDFLADTLSRILMTQVNKMNGKYLMKKTREIAITEKDQVFDCVLEMDISCEPYLDSRYSVNKAEILLTPEELPAFSAALRDYKIAFPLNTKQHVVTNPNIVCLFMESEEPADQFAERLAAALTVIGCL